MTGPRAPFAALLVVAGLTACGAPPPRIPAGEMTGSAHRAGETLIVYVGGERGTAPLEFEVAVDGVVVARDVLAHKAMVMPQPHKELRLALEPGEHVLRATANHGQAAGEWRFTVAGVQWAYLAYWKDDRKWTFDLSSEPIRFL